MNMSTVKRRDWSRAPKPRFVTRRDSDAWVVIDLTTEQIAEGTRSDGYTRASDALAAQRACIARHGAFL